MWLGKLRAQGYEVEMRELRACDFGAPTSRKRLFIVARRDGQPIVWPTPTHGPGRAHPHRTAAEVIDWSIPCPSIFERARSLADKTLARVVRGVRKYVLETGAPLLVPVTHAGAVRVHGIHEPMRTITGAHRGEFALAVPTLIQTGYGEREGQAPRVPGLDRPLGTVVAGGAKHALVAAFLAKHYGGNNEAAGLPMSGPMSTITTIDHHALVTAKMAPRAAVGDHAAEVRALLRQFPGDAASSAQGDLFGSRATDDGMVRIGGETFAIVDIGMRMLEPRELFRGQGFLDSYIIDPELDGVRLSKTAQIRMCGNSVSPFLSAALARANILGAAEAAA